MAIRSIRPAANAMRAQVSRPDLAKMAGSIGEAFDAIQDNLDQLVQTTSLLTSSSSGGVSPALLWTLNGPFLYPTGISDTIVLGYSSTDLAPASLVAATSIAVASASENASVGSLAVAAGSRSVLASTISGTGTYLPLAFDTNGSERMRITTGGIGLHGFTSTDLTLNAGAIVSADTIVCATASVNASVTGISAAGSRSSLYASRSGAGTFLPLCFDTNLNERMRITTGGVILSGITSTDVALGGQGGHVANDSIVSVSASVNASLISIGMSAGNYTALSSGRSGAGTFLPLTFWTSNAEAMRIDTSGRLLLGTTSASSIVDGNNVNLKIYNSASAVTYLEVLNDNGSNFANAQFILANFTHGNGTISSGGIIRCYSFGGTAAALAATPSGNILLRLGGGGYTNTVVADAGAINMIAGSLWTASNAETYMTFSTTPNGSTSASEQMRLASNGVLLVGQTSSDFTTSAARVIAATSIAVVNSATNASVGFMDVSTSNFVRVASHASGTGTFLPLTFLTNNAEQMRLTTGGALLISLTSTDATGSSIVTGTSGGLGNITIVSATSNASSMSIGVQAGLYGNITCDHTGSGTLLPLAFFVGHAERMRLTTGGLLGIGLTPTHQLQLSSDDAAKTTTTTWTTTSDPQLKTNRTPFTDGMAVLRQLTPETWQWNGLGGQPQGLSGMGLTAEGAHLTAIPYCYGQDMRSLTPAAVNPDGTVATPASPPVPVYTFNSHALFFVMINALKELDARLTAAKL